MVDVFGLAPDAPNSSGTWGELANSFGDLQSYQNYASTGWLSLSSGISNYVKSVVTDPGGAAQQALGSLTGVLPQLQELAGLSRLGAAAEETAAGARGLSGLGGVFSSETNAAGGTIWTSVGDISQNDVAPLVNSGMYNGEVNIISGVYGALNGSTTADLSLYEADVTRFGNLPGVNVYNFSEMTPGQIKGLLNGPGTTIGGFCNSGACLAPFR